MELPGCTEGCKRQPWPGYPLEPTGIRATRLIDEIRKFYRASGRPRRLAALGFALPAASTVLLAWLVFAFPWSPLALNKAQSQLSDGQTSSAMHTLASISRLNPFPSIRARALYQSAVVRTTLVDDPQGAVQDLDHLLDTVSTATELRTEALLLKAALLRDHAERHGVAAGIFEALARRHPGDPRRAEWLMSAALCRENNGQITRALLDRALVAVSQDPLAASAYFEMGRTWLLQDRPAKAYDCFQKAMNANPSTGIRNLTRRGMAAALEHLGWQGVVVAQLDDSESEQDESTRLARDRLLQRSRSHSAR